MGLERASFDVAVTCRGRPNLELLGPAGAFLYTDAGELIPVGPDAKALVPFPDAPPRIAEGVRAAPRGALLGWTRKGTLEVVSRDGYERRLANEGVVMAYPTGSGACVAVLAIDGGVRLRTLG